VEIHQVRPDEHKALGRLTVAAYEQLEGGEELGEYASALADVDDRARTAVVLVAVDDEGVLGGVTYVPGPTNPYAEGLEPGEVGIRMLAVSPDAQGRGIGRSLVMACLDRARRDGAHRVVLHSTPWMTVAHRLYESSGFRRATERDLSAGATVELLAFVLDLDGG
jgi:predicted N-acetyltransferase YhbS